MALTTNTKSQTMGLCNHAVGSLVTDASAAAAVSIAVGFVPRKIVLHNLTDRISQEWFEGMAANNCLQTVAVGTRTLDVANGPALGTAAAGTETTITFPATAMLASKTFAWEAIG